MKDFEEFIKNVGEMGRQLKDNIIELTKRVEKLERELK